MQDSTAKAISTVGIWLSVSIILTFGVFRTNWNDFGLLILAGVVLIICAAAAIGTAAVWGQLGSLKSDKDEKTRGFAVVMPEQKEKAS